MNPFTFQHILTFFLAINSRDISIKIIFQLCGISTPNMISLSARRQIPTGPPNQASRLPCLYLLNSVTEGQCYLILLRAETQQPPCIKSRKKEQIFFCHTHIQCLTTTNSSIVFSDGRQQSECALFQVQFTVPTNKSSGCYVSKNVQRVQVNYPPPLQFCLLII